jgi:dTDP-glucose 4,6-dehydratase
VYDEAKRYAEALTMTYHRVHEVPVRIARIFNTYGPRMREDDGRAVPTFIAQALRDAPITVHGDGSQTRSLCYVTDLVEGLWRFLNADLTGPVNLGSEEEISVLDLARLIRSIAQSASEVVSVERPVDDPHVRRPDVGLARASLAWTAVVGLRDGLTRTISSMSPAVRAISGA